VLLLLLLPLLLLLLLLSSRHSLALGCALGNLGGSGGGGMSPTLASSVVTRSEGSAPTASQYLHSSTADRQGPATP
jgi:hypothetical protein